MDQKLRLTNLFDVVCWMLQVRYIILTDIIHLLKVVAIVISAHFNPSRLLWSFTFHMERSIFSFLDPLSVQFNNNISIGKQ